MLLSSCLAYSATWSIASLIGFKPINSRNFRNIPAVHLSSGTVTYSLDLPSQVKLWEGGTEGQCGGHTVPGQQQISGLLLQHRWPKRRNPYVRGIKASPFGGHGLLKQDWPPLSLETFLELFCQPCHSLLIYSSVSLVVSCRQAVSGHRVYGWPEYGSQTFRRPSMV